MADDPRTGPAFDSNTLIRPTQRKLVGCWMERAGLPTLVLPQVWRELTATPVGLSATRHVLAWRRMRDTRSAPFRWATLSAEQAQSALALRRNFTQACFPRALPDEIENNSDAIIISEAIALDTDVLVTGDIRSIDHYEVNAAIAQTLGRNSHFVVTFDDALLQAYSGGGTRRRAVGHRLGEHRADGRRRLGRRGCVRRPREAPNSPHRRKHAAHGLPLAEPVGVLARLGSHSRTRPRHVRPVQIVALRTAARRMG